MDYEKTLTLLSETVKPVITKNEDQRKKKEEQGDFFNIFSILKVERDEVYTHSAMLCELLNPNGSHGMKDSFLQLFIKEMPLKNNKYENALDTLNAKVKKEEPIGTIDRMKETGGQIDILIEFENPNYAIIIENKIDAGDQNAQLARYYNYAKGRYGKNFTLLYLTKYGNEPSEIAKGKTLKGKIGKGNYWTCISYTKNVKAWLNKCMEKCADVSPVRGTIKQYINLIDKITDQELDMTDNKELLKTIFSENLCEVAQSFSDIWNQKDLLIGEIIATKIKENDKNWIIHKDHNEITIFKEIDNQKHIELFFEPDTNTIGFYKKNGIKTISNNLEKILNDIQFKYLNKGDMICKEDTFCYIFFVYKTSFDNNINIEEDFYNDIYEALKALEDSYKKKQK